MSLISSAASADSASALSAPECEPSHSASWTLTAEPCSGNIGRISFATPTSEPCEARTLDQLTLFAADFHARTSASPERAPASQASGQGYGASTPELLARFDHATSLWKTSQLCLDGVLETFSETWPRSGLMRNGTAYRLPPLVPLTAET